MMATSIHRAAAMVFPAAAADARAFVAQAHACFDDGLRRFFARRGVARDDIDDLIQDVYLRLARQPDVGGIRCAQAFVFTTAGNLLRDSYRRRSTRGAESSLDADGIDLPAEGVDPQRSAEFLQHLRAAHAVIRTLKPATQRVFLGHRVRGQSYAELAQELGVSISMIEKHMISAIAALVPVVQQSRC